MKKIMSSILFCIVLYLSSIAQTKIPDTRYGKDGFRTESTVTKGDEITKTTEYFEVRTIDGKKNELRREHSETTTDKSGMNGKSIRTTYQSDGITEHKIEKERFTEDSDNIYYELTEFGLNKRIVNAVKQELGFDGVWREFKFDYTNQEYKPNPKEMDKNKARSISQKSSGCLPSPNLFGGYSFLNRDYGADRLNSHGVTGSFTWYFRGNIINLPAGIKISASTASHKNGEEKISLQTFRAGPIITFNQNCNLMPSIFLQAGIARDGYKFADVKSSGSSFTASAGASLDWFFKEDIGLRLSTEALLTRFNDQSQWHFIGSTGIVYKIGNKAGAKAKK